MALNVQVHDFIRNIGHDGSEIIWPDLEEPTCRRGFHVQECINVLDWLWFSCTPFEIFPQHAPTLVVAPHIVQLPYGLDENSAFKRFSAYIQRGRGVITGRNTVGHAVAYNHGIVYDTNGSWYKYSPQECAAHNFIGICAWELHAIS